MNRFHTGSTTSTVRPCWNQPARTTSSSRESPRIWWSESPNAASPRSAQANASSDRPASIEYLGDLHVVVRVRQVAGYHFDPGVDVAGDLGERLQHPGQVEVPLT